MAGPGLQQRAYGFVAAVAVFYVVPSLLLYIFCQKFLVQMSIGGIKG
jgi:inositol-phosphate transport system permease protein